MSCTITVRQLSAPTDTEKLHVIEVLQAAFANDKALQCLTAESKLAEKAAYRMFLEAALKDGEVWVAGFDNRIDGAALWFRPGKDYTIASQQEYQGLFSEDMREWIFHHFLPKYQELYSTAYPTGGIIRMQAWHLKMIGVLPQQHRRGLGRALVRAVQEKADRNSQAMTTDVATSFSVYFLLLYWHHRSVNSLNSPHSPLNL